MGKICSKCGIEKPETEEFFPKHVRGKNGLNSRCRVCLADLCRQWHKDNKEHEKLYDEANKEIITEQHKRWRENNPGYGKQHYENNKETYLAKSKQWREDNPDLMNQYRKKWSENNSEKIKESQRMYRQNNPEARVASCKKYLEAHPVERSATSRKWAQNNPENRRMGCNLRRSRKRQLPSTLTAEQWKLIKEAFSNKCCYCGKEKPLTIEHFIPVSAGGELTINNVLPACTSCNCSKGTKSLNDWYPTFEHYSKQREKKILKYLNYKNGIQQLALL